MQHASPAARGRRARAVSASGSELGAQCFELERERCGTTRAQES
jgi:hypothetical protein